MTAEPGRATRIVLESSVRIDRVKEVQGQLLDALGSGYPVAVDGAQVKSIDALGLQLLVAAKRQAGSSGIDFVIETPSAPFVDAATLVGLADELGLGATGI